MDTKRTPPTRRDFVRFTAAAAALIPLANLTACSEEPAPKPAPTEPAAPGPETRAPAVETPAPPPAKPAAPAETAAPTELPRLAVDDPAAVALGYTHDATTVDTSKYPRRAGPEGAKQFCYNCALYMGGEGDEWSGCSIFPGKAVNGKGWCNVWAPKA